MVITPLIQIIQKTEFGMEQVGQKTGDLNTARGFLISGSRKSTSAIVAAGEGPGTPPGS